MISKKTGKEIFKITFSLISSVVIYNLSNLILDESLSGYIAGLFSFILYNLLTNTIFKRL